MMTLAAQVFWLSTILPGYALVGFLRPRGLGVLGTVARAYVMTVALLAPVVAAAYLLHLPIAYVAAAYACLIVASVLALVVRRPPLRRFAQVQPWWLVAVAVALVVAVLPLGTNMHYDASVHIAKIRAAIDIGFFLRDPYSPLDVPETRHMIGVHHALFSIGAWLTGSKPHEFWFYSAWFHRLLALGGIEALATAVYSKRRVGAIVVLGVIVMFLGEPSINLPTNVAGYVIIPVVLADVLLTLEGWTRRRLLGVALSSLALAAMHVAVWLTAVLCIGLGAACWLAVDGRGRQFVIRAGSLVLALATGLPFLILVAVQPNHAAEQQGTLFLEALRTMKLPIVGVIRVLDLMQFLWVGFAAAVLVLVASVRASNRGRVQLLLAVFGATAVLMFVPPVPGLLLHVVPVWVLRRSRYVAETIAMAGAFGGVVWMLARTLPSRRSLAALAAVALFSSVALFGQPFREWSWSVDRERGLVREMDALQDVLSAMGTKRALVAADPELSLLLPAVRELSVMSPPLGHSNPADGELLNRYRDVMVFLDPATQNDRRREIANRYGIHWVLLRSRDTAAQQVDWAGYGELVADRRGFRLYRLPASEASNR